MIRDDNRAIDVVRFWRAIELFSPQSVPKPDPTEPNFPVELIRDDRPLPWECGHRLHAPPTRKGFTRRHTIYLGIYRIDDVWKSLDGILDPGAENFDPRPSGECALAAIVVDEQGCYVTESGVMSSLAWAAGRAFNPGPKCRGWLDGFDQMAEKFNLAVADVLSHTEFVDDQLPFDHDTLEVLRVRCAALLGAESLGINVNTIRIASREVATPADEGQGDFLNSFIANDLAHVVEHMNTGNTGQGLTQYLTEDAAINHARRVDLRMNVSATLNGCRPAATPPGRWPSPLDQPLALSQQFAVNAIMGELNSSAGIFAVNGPPGTGKTTLLKDLVAGIVVERAQRIAALIHPRDAFVSNSPHRWNSGDYPRTVQRWNSAFHGFEIVVASSNNGAVENISNEIPLVGKLAACTDDADYFAEIATDLLNVDNAPGPQAEPQTAWALLAARLGKKSNRTRFVDTLWFDKKIKSADDHTRLGLQSMLKELEIRGPERPWLDATNAFKKVHDNVTKAMHERDRAYSTWNDLITLEKQLPNTVRRLDIENTRLATAAAAEQECAEILRRELNGRQHFEEELRRHAERRGQWWQRLGKTARAQHRQWLTQLSQLTAHLGRYEHAYTQAWTDHQAASATLVGTQNDNFIVAAELHSLTTHIAHLNLTMAEYRTRWGDAVPNPELLEDPQRREKSALWADQEVNELRSQLFVAALELHREFLGHVPKQMRQSLHGAMDVVGGSAPKDLAPDIVADAWRALFFLVPLVSTTFASFDRVFRGLDAASLGWLLIDEAGQSTPQNPVGAIWRSQRTVIVGDPLQLEPVVTIPFRAQQAVRQEFGASETWLPAHASAQSIADRLNRWGTTLNSSDGPIWVGAPLRVHRRCKDPMFTVVNEIAYAGTMVHGGNPKPQDPLRPSQWLDVTGPAVGHFVQAEYILLQRCLESLVAEGQPMSEVIVISPFRDVARRLTNLPEKYPGIKAGTVHTAQGKEADIVFLVLGGDPSKAGAKRWASSKPNLLNVAVSRAKLRLYVIGDRAAWSQHARFDVLARELDRTGAA